MIEEMQGGIVMVARGKVLDALPLPVVGPMSDGTPEKTATAIRRLTKLVHGHYGISQDSDAFIPLFGMCLAAQQESSRRRRKTHSEALGESKRCQQGHRRQDGRLHHWRAKYVQQIVEHQAHRCGTRIRRVCSWNTSKLAFDGTGDVTRDTDNYSMCTFQTGKRYSCDLSASYNIGARYFLREYEKSISATRWRCIAAKVPSCAKRITRTLDTLIRVNAELRSM
ncbi:adenine deaminase C-terminal domain-containing protein [uncultured Sutterella sp.]|uniref:adenine deaminase C-terminal domain-containing protein n=1 Tax=uncultured Sutterella sp. TaxID=286133 RepID=UPI0034A05C51